MHLMQLGTLALTFINVLLIYTLFKSPLIISANQVYILYYI
jgi:hypothetical protein